MTLPSMRPTFVEGVPALADRLWDSATIKDALA
jgi:hypothetical protein